MTATKSPRRTLLGLRNIPFPTVLDVGANKGQFARYIGVLLPLTHIYCFEPLPSAIQELNKWAERYLADRITTFHLALGDRETDISLFEHIDHTSSSSILPATSRQKALWPFTENQKPCTVQMTTLDNFCKRTHLSLMPELLIKLDVQGYEDRVIRGAQETLRQCKAVLLEVNLESLYERQASFHDLVRLLHNAGLTYAGNFEQTYDDSGRAIFVDAMFVRAPDAQRSS